MSDKNFPDEMLMRFADGELSADEMAVIEKAMETDDDLVGRVAMSSRSTWRISSRNPPKCGATKKSA
jgi:anti-sigma factor RsiW